MAKKRGNPNWGKPELNTAPYTGATSFEEVAKRLCLSPQEYGNSVQLRDWVQKNKDHKYVPSNLLELWGLEVKGESGVPSAHEPWSMVHGCGSAAICEMGFKKDAAQRVRLGAASLELAHRGCATCREETTQGVMLVPRLIAIQATIATLLSLLNIAQGWNT